MNIATLNNGLSANNATTNWAPTAIRTSQIDQTNPNYPRVWKLDANYVTLAQGSNVAGVLLSALLPALIALVPQLTWPPIIGTQPSNLAVVHTAGGSFSIAATSEISITYQWAVSTNGGSTWSNITTAGTPVYSGYTTNTLSFTTSATSMNNYQYRCVATNASGSTTSNAAILTVT